MGVELGWGRILSFDESRSKLNCICFAELSLVLSIRFICLSSLCCE